MTDADWGHQVYERRLSVSIFVEQIQSRCVPISPEMQADFAPVVGCLYEWRDYWLEHPRPPGGRSG